MFQTLVTYLVYFYTDIYGLKTEHASLLILTAGLIAAFGFNPVIGALADRTNSRWGKFRPWILLTAIPLGIVALLAFSTPHFSYQGKVIYAVVTYTLLLLLCAASNLPYSALSGVITGDITPCSPLASRTILCQSCCCKFFFFLKRHPRFQAKQIKHRIIFFKAWIRRGQ
ncbi:MFS transporter [Parafilimonas sp.]|uniref:MFS transporter n=1 Tax=Parafilimonas sp. TaxID=1969739 RepID=UPI0039E216DE